MSKNFHELYEHKELLMFAMGVGSAIVGKKILESDSVKKHCTKMMANVLQFKKDSEECFQNMKDDAEDIVEDASQREKKEIYV